MNDEFLHRLRKAPPRDFAARLKTRLDREERVRRSEPRQTWLNGFAAALVGAGALSLITLALLAVFSRPDGAAERPAPIVVRETEATEQERIIADPDDAGRASAPGSTAPRKDSRPGGASLAKPSPGVLSPEPSPGALAPEPSAEAVRPEPSAPSAAATESGAPPADESTQ